MDSRYLDPDHEDSHSHNPRSRVDSCGISTAAARFQTLQLVESPAATFDTASYTSSRPPSSQGFASPVYLGSPLLPQQHAAFLSTPVAQTSHLPLLPERGVLDVDWFETPRRDTHGNPLLQLEASSVYSSIPTSSPSIGSESETMSAVAIPYDHGFSMASRPTIAWPVMESSSGLMHDPSSYTSDASLTPSTASRSVTASPPRGAFGAEQRELKRQRDQIRRDNKMQVRSQRTGSGSSMYSNPVGMGDITTGASALPIYSTAPSGIPLLADSHAPYMSSFSPPVQANHGHANNMFPASYPQSPYMADYPSYPSTSAPSLPAQYGYVHGTWANKAAQSTGDANGGSRRSMMTTDPSVMYSVPPVMTGPPAPQDPGHVRVVQVQNRPKPQCWEHGCNGRQFSTFSNLLRHQREKSGQAAKATCPHCGAEFTRTTARNGHVAHEKCKAKRNSSSNSSSSSS